MRQRLTFFILFLLVASLLDAKNRHTKPSGPPQDQIAAVARIPITGSPITRLFTTHHYGRDYLYAEHASDNTITLIDTTKIDHPAVLAGISYPAGAANNLAAVTGNAALLASAQSPATPSGATAVAIPQTFRIMSFANPLHPDVKQVFTGVTSMSADEKRGLIYLANAGGIWVLQEQYAIDPAFEKSWEHMMLDAH